MVKRLAVLGQPIGHSRSPAMHSAALAAVGLAGEWSYEAIEVSPAGLEGLVRSMAARGFVGANVTIPHKQAALALADSASEAARQIGASNTLVLAGDGIHADNTDAAGLISALGMNLTGKRAVVLGAGGAGRAAVWALRQAGARVSVWNRTEERGRRLAGQMSVDHLEHPSSPELFATVDLIVNATAVGLTPPANSGANPQVDSEPVDSTGQKLMPGPLVVDAITDKHVVVDLVYGASETELTRAARKAGARVVTGLDVLVGQGAESFRIWTGIPAPVAAMREAIEAEI